MNYFGKSEVFITPYLVIMHLFILAYFSAHYTAVFCAQLCCSGLGYAISTIFNPKSSQMASVVVILVMTMLSGKCLHDQFIKLPRQLSFSSSEVFFFKVSPPLSIKKILVGGTQRSNVRVLTASSRMTGNNITSKL